jgi:creatinine amidohydrolase
MMLHLHPDLVKMDRAKNFVSRAIAVEAENTVLRIEGSTGIGWQTQDLNADGACGDAAHSDAAKGKELVERAATALAALAAEVARYLPTITV